MGELVKCKTSKIYHTTKNSYQARHIWPPSWIPETLARHVWPLFLIWVAELREKILCLCVSHIDLLSILVQALFLFRV
jgi:hypothetical protein